MFSYANADLKLYVHHICLIPQLKIPKFIRLHRVTSEFGFQRVYYNRVLYWFHFVYLLVYTQVSQVAQKIRDDSQVRLYLYEFGARKEMGAATSGLLPAKEILANFCRCGLRD